MFQDRLMNMVCDNPDKTKSVIFGSAPNLLFLATKPLPLVVVDNHPVEYVNPIKNRSVILTTDLTWNSHIRSSSLDSVHRYSRVM